MRKVVAGGADGCRYLADQIIRVTGGGPSLAVSRVEWHGLSRRMIRLRAGGTYYLPITYALPTHIHPSNLIVKGIYVRTYRDPKHYLPINMQNLSK